MPTYNFKTNREIEVDGLVKQTIEGPAVLSPRYEAGTIMFRYLNGSDLYYWPTNTFQIDGETFEGNLVEFCSAANELYVEASSGGGGYSDVTDNTTIEVSDNKSFIIKTNLEDKELFKVESDTLGDFPSTMVTIGQNDATDGTKAYFNIQEYTASSPAADSALEIDMGGGTYSKIHAHGASGYAQVMLETSANGIYSYVDLNGYVEVKSGDFSIKVSETGIELGGIVEYADNAAAITGGLSAGQLYRTAGAIKIVI